MYVLEVESWEERGLVEVMSPRLFLYMPVGIYWLVI